MMNKKSPRKQRVLLHKLIILNTAMVNTLDEIDPENEGMQEFVKQAKDFAIACEELDKSVFDGNEQGRAYTDYISDVVSKVDTVIRKNVKD